MRTTRQPGNGVIEIVEAPDPVPGPGEVVVRTAVSAICGSEMHAYRGPGHPTGNGGHEAAGTVIEVGPDVTKLQVGQRVGVSGVVGCGECAWCAAGRYTWCRTHPHYSSMHAERILAAARACLPLPDDIGWDVGVLITGDGMGVPYRTSRRLLDPAIETVAIFGMGPIGLGNAIMQTYLGRRVIAVDVIPYRLELAVGLGAAEALDARAVDPVAALRELTDGEGPDVCLEAAGRPETLRQCFAAVRTGGTVAINGEQGKLELSPSDDFIRRDITAFGSWFYFYSEFPEMLELVRQGLPAADLITHHYAFAEADAAYKEFAAGRAGKALLVYE